MKIFDEYVNILVNKVRTKGVRTNDNVVTIDNARIVRSSVTSVVSDPAVLCVEETPSPSSISSPSRRFELCVVVHPNYLY